MKSFHFLLFGLVLGSLIEDLQARYLLVEVDANSGNKLEGTSNNSIMSVKNIRIELSNYFISILMYGNYIA